MALLRTAWRAGPVRATGPVLVSVTDFTCARPLDLARAFRAGMALRRSWPELEGAVGLWLWTDLRRRRCGSVSVWTDEAALRGFVAWPPHVAVMRGFRRRGTIRAGTWQTEAFEPAETWARAERVLAQFEEGAAPQIVDASR
ncbi:MULTISPECIES: hypothetical protein [unclassified Actinomadura]|uniref:hypothetical protein n=1 Tax=unclassified Actinomadura TaxID=2626254 RepID=UPI0011EBC43A|nr:hypothetical protein [Actinomadura sp. K4S16]